MRTTRDEETHTLMTTRDDPTQQRTTMHGLLADIASIIRNNHVSKTFLSEGRHADLGEREEETRLLWPRFNVSLNLQCKCAREEPPPFERVNGGESLLN